MAQTVRLKIQFEGELQQMRMRLAFSNVYALSELEFLFCFFIILFKHKTHSCSGTVEPLGLTVLQKG